MGVYRCTEAAWGRRGIIGSNAMYNSWGLRDW